MKFLAAYLLFANLITPTPEQIKNILHLEDRLMAPCCYSQTIRVHMSMEAAQMREEVTDKVMAGESEQEIIAYYKAKYGETILVVPDGLAGRFAFGVPIGVALVAAFLLISGILHALRRRSLQVSAMPAIHASTVPAELLKRLRSDLEESL